MATADEGVVYSDLFDVIKKYARMDLPHQIKALSLIRENVTPFGNLPVDDIKTVVEDILQQHGYLLWFGGRPTLAGIDTVVNVARMGSSPDWGVTLLWTMIEALVASVTNEIRTDEAQGGAMHISSMHDDDLRRILEGLHCLEEHVWPSSR